MEGRKVRSQAVILKASFCASLIKLPSGELMQDFQARLVQHQSNVGKLFAMPCPAKVSHAAVSWNRAVGAQWALNQLRA